MAVSTTKIYCRPVCTVRTPGRDRCTFYATAAAAERAGYRPCLRCRPELAPGNARVDAISRQALAIANRIEDGYLTDHSLADIASELGVSDRHLRRIIEQEFGVAPIELVQTQRLLLAKRLLADTKLSITAIASASGFSSVRRFNAVFQERYRMSPTRVRQSSRTKMPQLELTSELNFRPPLDWRAMISFLQKRAIVGVEVVTEEAYLRTFSYKSESGWVKIEPVADRNCLRVTVPIALAGAFSSIAARTKRLFDLTADSEAISVHLKEMGDLIPGLRVPGAFDGFEMAVRAILGQQVSVRGASTLAARYARQFGTIVETPFGELNIITPSAERVAAASLDDIASIGMPTARARTIRELAVRIANGQLSLEPGLNAELTMEKLKSIPGIGEWTAQYIAMRALSWPDAFPHTDLGISKALNEKAEKKILARAEVWRPWRSYATMHLWSTLEVQA